MWQSQYNNPARRDGNSSLPVPSTISPSFTRHNTTIPLVGMETRTRVSIAPSNHGTRHNTTIPLVGMEIHLLPHEPLRPPQRHNTTIPLVGMETMLKINSSHIRIASQYNNPARRDGNSQPGTCPARTDSAVFVTIQQSRSSGWKLYPSLNL